MIKALHQTIREKYHEPEILISILIEFQIDKLIVQALKMIDGCLKMGEFKQLPNISGSILTAVNNKIREIKNVSDKRKIEYLLSDFFIEIIAEIATLPNGKELLSDIKKSLQSACELNGFNFQKLEQYLHFERHQTLPRQKIKLFKPIYYDWNRKDKKELDCIIGDMKGMDIIYNKRDFQKIFKPVKEELVIHCNPSKKDLLFVIFQILKEEKLISIKGGNGHFAPLFQYVTDKQSFSLYKKAPNKVHEKLKRNKDNYLILREKAKKLIVSNLNNE